VKIPVEKLDTLTGKAAELGPFEKARFVKKGYENVKSFWDKAVDKVIDFNVKLPDNALALGKNCFQCVVSGGKYTTSLVGIGKCQRGTTAAENDAKPAHDKNLKMSDFMTSM
jgi:hypothetical protein